MGQTELTDDEGSLGILKFRLLNVVVPANVCYEHATMLILTVLLEMKRQRPSINLTHPHRCPFWLVCLNNRGPWFRWFVPFTRAIYFSKRPPMRTPCSGLLPFFCKGVLNASAYFIPKFQGSKTKKENLNLLAGPKGLNPCPSRWVRI